MARPAVDPKRTGVRAVRHDFGDDWPEYGEPGLVAAFCGTVLHHTCPGCGRFGGIRVGHPKPTNGPSWAIVGGSLEAPETLSLAPSIHCVGCCGWHGYLAHGVFVSC